MTGGKAHLIGDDVDTDLIIAGRHIGNTNPDYLARHCLENLVEGFHARVSPGDVLIAGRNFGCGSSREHAPISLKATGLSGIVARSFSRIFFRSAINIGLPVMVCPEAVDTAEDGVPVSFTLAGGTVTVGQSRFAIPLQPPQILEIIEAGGLVPLMTRRIAAEASA